MGGWGGCFILRAPEWRPRLLFFACALQLLLKFPNPHLQGGAFATSLGYSGGSAAPAVPSAFTPNIFTEVVHPQNATLMARQAALFGPPATYNRRPFYAVGVAAIRNATPTELATHGEGQVRDSGWAVVCARAEYAKLTHLVVSFGSDDRGDAPPE